MRILLTGASGFMGRRIAPKLAAEGVDVIAVDRNPDPHLNIRAYYQGDICRSQILNEINEEVDAVIHLAADVDICAGYDCMVDNIYGVFLLTQWARRNNAGKFIYPSTIGIFDALNDGAQADERYPIAPASLYGMTKYLGENCLNASGIEAILLRFPYIYGPGDLKGAIANIFHSIAADKPPKIRNERRDYLHIDDAIDAIMRALEYQGEERVFNVGSGTLTEMKEIVNLISGICGTQPKMRIEGTRNNLATDFSLAAKELNWAPARSLDSGLREEVAFLNALQTAL